MALDASRCHLQEHFVAGVGFCDPVKRFDREHKVSWFNASMMYSKTFTGTEATAGSCVQSGLPDRRDTLESSGCQIRRNPTAALCVRRLAWRLSAVRRPSPQLLGFRCWRLTLGRKLPKAGLQPNEGAKGRNPMEFLNRLEPRSRYILPCAGSQVRSHWSGQAIDGPKQDVNPSGNSAKVAQQKIGRIWRHLGYGRNEDFG